MEHFYKIALHDAGADAFRVVLNQNNNFSVVLQNRDISPVSIVLDGVTTTNTVGADLDIYLRAKLIEGIAEIKPIYGDETMVLSTESMGSLIREYSTASNKMELSAQFEDYCKQLMAMARPVINIGVGGVPVKNTFSYVSQEVEIASHLDSIVKSAFSDVGASIEFSDSSSLPRDSKFMKVNVTAITDTSVANVLRAIYSEGMSSLGISVSGSFDLDIYVKLDGGLAINASINNNAEMQIFTVGSNPIYLTATAVIAKSLLCASAVSCLSLGANADALMQKRLSGEATSMMSISSGSLIRVVFRLLGDIDNHAFSDFDTMSLSELYTIELD